MENIQANRAGAINSLRAARGLIDSGSVSEFLFSKAVSNGHDYVNKCEKECMGIIKQEKRVILSHTPKHRAAAVEILKERIKSFEKEFASRSKR